MIKIIESIIKRIIVSIFVLYGINIITSNIDFILPINAISVGTISFLGLPGLIAIISLYFLI